MEWERLITERNAWVAHNFPDSPPIESVYGVVEELGELAHAHLKLAQHIRGSKEELIAKGKDAVGDLIVYLLGVMNWQGYWPEETMLVPRRFAEDSGHWLLKLTAAVGRLAEQPQWKVPVHNIVYYTHCYTNSRGWRFEDIVNETWDQVKQRDWQKDPVAGGE